MKSVAVIGLGLMGGSLVKALKATNKYYVIGYNRSKSVIERALSEGAVDSVWDGESKLSADITVVCFNPDITVDFFKNKLHLIKKGSILTDICGIKKGIVSVGEELCKEADVRFVGGHPMAGRERSGYENSVADLFFNRSYIFTKTENTDEQALNDLKELALDIGCADVTITTPEEHDRMIAFTSQLPHVLAGAYIKSPQSDNHKGYSAGSYHDVSRVASVDERLWSELFSANKENLVWEIENLIKNLEEYKTAIAEGDRNKISDVIKAGRLLKERDIVKNGDEKPHKFG